MRDWVGIISFFILGYGSWAALALVLGLAIVGLDTLIGGKITKTECSRMSMEREYLDSRDCDCDCSRLSCSDLGDCVNLYEYDACSACEESK